jgi:hypothetical protein
MACTIVARILWECADKSHESSTHQFTRIYILETTIGETQPCLISRYLCLGSAELLLLSSWVVREARTGSKEKNDSPIQMKIWASPVWMRSFPKSTLSMFNWIDKSTLQHLHACYLATPKPQENLHSQASSIEQFENLLAPILQPEHIKCKTSNLFQLCIVWNYDIAHHLHD